VPTRPRLIIAAALVASPLAAWLVFASEHDENALLTAASVLFVSWSFIGAGLVALARTPGGFGSLLCATGLAVQLGALGDANGSIPFTAGLIVGSLWIGLLVHALLAFPEGRLPTRITVAIATAAYGVVTVGPLLALLFDDLAAECPECPDNAVLVAADADAAEALDAVVGTTGAVVALAVAVALALRRRSASGPLRRALTPVVATGGAALVALALVLPPTPSRPERMISTRGRARRGGARPRAPGRPRLRAARPGLSVAYWRPEAQRVRRRRRAAGRAAEHGERTTASVMSAAASRSRRSSTTRRWTRS
jgi:hypothetical protein